MGSPGVYVISFLVISYLVLGQLGWVCSDLECENLKRKVVGVGVHKLPKKRTDQPPARALSESKQHLKILFYSSSPNYLRGRDRRITVGG
jgi:hypothetical protein